MKAMAASLKTFAMLSCMSEGTWPQALRLSDFSSCDSIGDKLATVLAEFGRWTLDIVRRPAAAEGFVILPRRWVVERTFAWLGRCRRPAKNVERRPKARPPEHSPPTCAA